MTSVTALFYQAGKMSRNTVAGSASEGYRYADDKGLCYEGEDMRLAADFLMRYGTGNTLQERVKTAYLYLAHQCPYKRRYTSPKVGSDMADMAIDMFTNKNGDCYRFAGAFAYLAKLGGYRVRVTLGETGGGHVDHGWTEVYINGKWLYCDSQAEIPQFEYPDYTMYMKEKHPWAVISHWSTELTLQNGKAVWK